MQMKGVIMQFWRADSASSLTRETIFQNAKLTVGAKNSIAFLDVTRVYIICLQLCFEFAEIKSWGFASGRCTQSAFKLREEKKTLLLMQMLGLNNKKRYMNTTASLCLSPAVMHIHSEYFVL